MTCDEVLSLLADDQNASDQMNDSQWSGIQASATISLRRLRLFDLDLNHIKCFASDMGIKLA